MKRTMLTVLTLAAFAGQSLAAELRLSIGIRETNSPGPVGSNGGATGGIEWVGRTGGTGLDLDLVPADNAWHQVTIDLVNDPVGAFAGATADSILTSTTGFSVLEHLRIANTADGVTRYKVYIDDIMSIQSGTSTLLTGFEGAALGSEVMFQEPRFSGSTAALLQTTPNIARVSDAVAFSGTQSYEVEFDFVNDTPAGTGGAGNWLRLTTNNVATLGNPVIAVPNTMAGAPFPPTSLSMQVRVVAIPEPVSLMLAAVAACGLMVATGRRRSF
jgi:hypothetical protein